MRDPVYTDGAVLLYHGDCIEVLRTLEANSIDACLTDPPYLLNFMNKAFDSQHKTLAGANEGQRMQAWYFAWASAVFRVLKPGAHLVAMGGTRTHHRLMCALEDAGFEVRDCLMYIYGSGWPKSLDVSKAIDKEAGIEREVVGENPNHRASHATADNTWRLAEGRPASPSSSPILTAPATDAAKAWDGYGSALKPAYEPVILCRKPLDGTLAQNVQRWGTGALAIDACRVLTGDDTTTRHSSSSSYMTGKIGEVQPKQEPYVTGSSQGRWPANILTDGSDEVRAMFPDTSSSPDLRGHGAGVRPYGFGNVGAEKGSQEPNGQLYPDTGSAARFFATCPPDDPPQRFLYTSKVSPDERNGSTHPTQKPLSLMTWLLTLVTRPGALVLDPFLGSGTTAVTCHRLKRRCIGIEREAEYLAIAQKRMEQEWYQEQQTLF